MSDLYVEMCRGSPVQKDWKKKIGDVLYLIGTDEEGILLEIKEECLQTGIIGDVREDSVFRLPRQEDWQNIYSIKAPYDTQHAFNEIIWFYKLLDTEIALDYPRALTIAWCLFVHREVYNLEWDWDNSKWVKNEVQTL